ncbi:MAG: sigma-70 family RNA polymerase sigma factor [Acidobacteria bacterium]|nr:sigma-70 family RNA polymerase sigma factor [Acidobacteriota bacterium]
MEASIIDSAFKDGPGPESREESGTREIGATVRRIASGEVSALAELYDACAPRLFALALWRTGSREDAADVVQEVFVRLAQTGEALARVRRPLPYLLRMTHNLAVSTLRRRRHNEPVDTLLVAGQEAGAEARFAARQATALLAELPPKQREALYLRHFEGLSYREIGAVTGVPTFTAASRCRNGLARLRRLMGVAP